MHEHLLLYNDKEAYEAYNADEKEQVYKCQMYNRGTVYRLYKPSVAMMLAKRTGLKYELVPDGVTVPV